MIEKTILDYLSDSLDVPCYMEFPENAPDAFVLIEKTGDSIANHISSAVIAVQSYGASMFNAAVLNENVKELMLSLPDQENDITNVSLNSDYNFTDTSTKRYRYQAVFDVVHY